MALPSSSLAALARANTKSCSGVEMRQEASCVLVQKRSRVASSASSSWIGDEQVDALGEPARQREFGRLRGARGPGLDDQVAALVRVDGEIAEILRAARVAE